VLTEWADVSEWQLSHVVEPDLIAAMTRAEAEEWQVAHDSAMPPMLRR
jgi:hypothetical protein